MTDAKQRVQRYRTAKPRHDYYPGPDAQRAVNWFKARNPSFTMQEVLDSLVNAGGEHFEQSEKRITGNVTSA
jgi:hypothetical protein